MPFWPFPRRNGRSSWKSAFKTYCEIYPTNAVLLVDTYNTLKSGVPDAIRAFNEVLRPLGITKCGIRLDSGARPMSGCWAEQTRNYN